MNTFYLKGALSVLIVLALLGRGHLSSGALLLHYEFESVEGIPASQTTPDATGNYVSNADPFFGGVNLLNGPGAEPGVDYPQLVTGTNLVSNSLYKSLNPDSAIFAPAGTSNGRAGVTIADINTGVLDTQLPAFSLAVWVNPSTTDNHRYIAGKFGTSTNRGWQFTSPLGTTDLDVFYFGTSNDADNSSRRYLLSNVLPLDSWTHVAFTFDGANQVDAVYINGVSQTLVNYAGTSPVVPTQINGANNQDLWVGHRGATGSTVRSWTGYLDDFRIYTHALAASEVLELLVPVTTAIPGDFDGDGDVDGADFVAWQTNFPTASGATLAMGDADGDGDVDGADFVVWQTNFPYTPGPGASPIPEPSAVILVLIGLLATAGRRLRHS